MIQLSKCFFNALPGHIVTGPVKNYVNPHFPSKFVETASRLPWVRNSFKIRQGKLRGPQVGRDCQWGGPGRGQV